MNDCNFENAQNECACKSMTRKQKIIRAFLIMLAFAFIAIGISRGDALVIFRKAIFVCMECIGIG